MWGAPMATALICSDSVKDVRGSLAQPTSKIALSVNARNTYTKLIMRRPWSRSRRVALWRIAIRRLSPHGGRLLLPATILSC
jgi:hypothetical protein